MSARPQISTVPAWTTDDLPVCSLGMDLQRRLQSARPNDYASLQGGDLVDLNTSAFDGILESDDVTVHCATREDCKDRRSA